jgi:hypothetical protein
LLRFASSADNRKSGATALGMGLMSMDDSDSEDEDAPPARTTRSPPPIAAPKPGYVTQPIDLARPEPIAIPDHRQTPQLPSELAMQQPPRTPSTDPHPLRAPVTPIQPAFARPKKAEPTVEFKAPIMRSDSEDPLLPRRGNAKGEDFWRRFSIVAHEDANKKPNEKHSKWLAKTQNGTASMSRWVWCVGLMLLIFIGAAAGLGYYFSHQNHSTVETAPRTVGGQAGNNSAVDTASTAQHATGTGAHTATSFQLVVPTKTVARREPAALNTGIARVHNSLRHRHNRILDLD